jgi:hypothetical protein
MAGLADLFRRGPQAFSPRAFLILKHAQFGGAITYNRRFATHLFCATETYEIVRNP